VPHRAGDQWPKDRPLVPPSGCAPVGTSAIAEGECVKRADVEYLADDDDANRTPQAYTNLKYTHEPVFDALTSSPA
jgi:hypothetical protein